MKVKILKISACILIAILLWLGFVIALSYAVRNARAVVKLGDITVDAGTVTYLASLYKLDYLASVDPAANPEDTDAFWDSEIEEGVTYGEDFERRFKEYLSYLVVDAYLYITYHGYTPEDKLAVAQITDKVLLESAAGSVERFAEIADDHGYEFDFNDFQNATALSYKAERGNAALPASMSEEERTAIRVDAPNSIKFSRAYSLLRLDRVPMINQLYVK